MNRVAITPRFEKSLRRLHPNVKKAAIKAIKNLMTNPESKRLNLEPLASRDSYSIRAAAAPPRSERRSLARPHGHAGSSRLDRLAKSRHHR
jgi:hypothetical protein